MTQFKASFSSVSRIGSRASRVVMVAAVALGAGSSVSAQAFRSEILGLHLQTEIKIEASSPEIVRLLAGIIEIRSDLQLGLLVKHDGLPAAHINDALTADDHYEMLARADFILEVRIGEQRLHFVGDRDRARVDEGPRSPEPELGGHAAVPQRRGPDHCHRDDQSIRPDERA